jgi:hypothetical protein
MLQYYFSSTWFLGWKIFREKIAYYYYRVQRDRIVERVTINCLQLINNVFQTILFAHNCRQPLLSVNLSSLWSRVRLWTILRTRTIQCKIKQKYGVILKQFLKGRMKNFAFQNRVLQRDRVLERRVLEREYCSML